MARDSFWYETYRQRLLCDDHHSFHTPGVPECHPGDGIAGSGNLAVGSQGARGPIVSVLVSRAFSGHGLGTIYGAMTMGVGLGGMSGAWLSGVFYDKTGGYILSYSVSVVVP